MSLSAAAQAIRGMMAAGFTLEQALVAIEKMDEAKRSTAKSNAERQAEFRARQKAARNAVTSNESNVTPVTGVADGASRECNNPPPCAEPEPNKTTYPTTSEAKASSVEPRPVEILLDGEILPPSPSPSEAVPGKARGSPPSTRGTRLPPDYRPTPSTIEWCRDNQRLTDEQFSDCLAEFRDYWSGVPGHRGLKCDWDGTFRNAVRKRFPSGGPRQAYASGNQRPDGSRLGAYQRAAAFVRAQNDVPAERGGVLDL